MATNLAAMLAQLKLENKELKFALEKLDHPVTGSSSKVRNSVDVEHLERDLQRARNKYDAALQNRQQQVAELEQLTMKCQEMLQPSGEHYCM